jgi:hypothetical protein
MTRRTLAGSPRFWSIVVLGMDPDSPRIGKLFVFAVAGKTEIVVVIGFGQLGSTRPSMGIVAIKT